LESGSGRGVSRWELLWHFVYSDFFGRYRGSAFGIVLALVNPLTSLLIYTFIFGMVFGSRFPGLPEGQGAFALALFSGMIFYNLFSDAVARAATIIAVNRNFVTKVVFPLEILPMALAGSSLFTFVASGFILVGGILLLGLFSGVYALLALLWIPPILFLTAGVCWILATIGTFIRDIEAFVPPLLLLLTFLSAIFYPISAVPERVQWFFKLNPFALAAENVRSALLMGEGFSFLHLGYGMVVGLLFFVVGWVFFNKAKPYFADAV
jgi:lipopolysaccharide transport system permease protein